MKTNDLSKTTKKEFTFTDEGIEFSGYTFSPSSVYPCGTVKYSDIKEILPDFFPPEIRTHSGEILFVSAPYKEELKKAAEKNKIPSKRRPDIWSFILEPFLDTEFSEEDKERTLRILESNGVSRKLCEELRMEAGEAMYAYNISSGLWEWIHLGLYDLLCAFCGYLSGEKFKMPETKFKEFYWRAMEIANRENEKIKTEN